MNKLVIAVVAGFFLGNDKARNELSKFIKSSTTKTIDLINKNKENSEIDILESEAGESNEVN
jgi:hypothetical protein